MNDTPTSGNRWERPADEPAPAADQTAEAPAVAEPTPAARRDWRATVTRPRMQLAGAALVIFLVGGGAGFAVGATTGGGQDDRGDFPGGQHFGDGRGFGGPPGGFPGQQPGQQQPFGQQNDGSGT